MREQIYKALMVRYQYQMEDALLKIDMLMATPQLGAYGLTFRTQFNGFFSDEIYEVEDNPIISLYNQETKNQFLVA